jgi:hypothetical protein
LSIIELSNCNFLKLTKPFTRNRYFIGENALKLTYVVQECQNFPGGPLNLALRRGKVKQGGKRPQGGRGRDKGGKDGKRRKG